MPELMPIVLPKAGMNMVAATIVSWRRQPGDHVERGEAIVEIETDKVEMVIEAPATGTLREILVQPDEDADVGAHLGLIEVEE